MKITLTDRMQPIETKMPLSNLERKPVSILPKVILPIDPSILQGLDQEGIDQLVPASARKGTAADGGPKWSWVDAWGIRWEVRFHPYANTTFPSRPSGCGSTIRFGMQVLQGAFGEEEILAIDRELIEKYGLSSQSEQMQAAQYVDKFGYIYLDINGDIVGLYSDEGHIKGTGNYWQPSFVMSLEEFLQMPSDENTIYQDMLDLLQRYDSRTAARLVEAILFDWDKKLIEISRSDNPRWAGEAFWAGFNQLPSNESHKRLPESASSLSEIEISRLAASWADRLVATASPSGYLKALTYAVREWINTCNLDEVRQDRESDQQTIEKILWVWWCSLV
jgi:hypothetical protein